MSFDILMSKYGSFEHALAKAKIISLTNEDQFKKFPDNLPDHVLEIWKTNIDVLIKGKGPEASIFGNYDLEPHLTFFHPIYILLKGLSKRQLVDNFDQLCFQQELLSYFAFTEGFLQDMQRIIYSLDNRMLKSATVVKWETIIDLDTKDDIINYLIDEKLARSGFDKADELLDSLCKSPFNLNFTVDELTIFKLKEYRLIRNLIIHNGGKVSRDYINHVKTTRKTVGQVFVLTRRNMDNLFACMLSVGFGVVAAISEKFYNKEQDQLYKSFPMPVNFKIQWV